MATNSSDVQRRADSKRSKWRGCCWESIVYPDSAPVDWLQRLAAWKIEALVSPLHDKDTKSNGVLAKLHYHVIIKFGGAVGFKRALEVFDDIGATYPDPQNTPDEFLKHCRITNLIAAARYLCHIDEQDKFQYDSNEVIAFGGIEYADLAFGDDRNISELYNIFKYMEANDLCSYPALVRSAAEEHPEWKTLIAKKFHRQIAEYARGMTFEKREKRNG